jgi:hypothetical protein
MKPLLEQAAITLDIPIDKIKINEIKNSPFITIDIGKQYSYYSAEVTKTGKIKKHSIRTETCFY